MCRCTTKNEPFFTATKGTRKKRTATTPVNIKVKNKKPKTNLHITNPEDSDQTLTAKGTTKIRIGKHINYTVKYLNIQEYEEDIGTNISYTQNEIIIKIIFFQKCIENNHLNYRPGSRTLP